MTRFLSFITIFFITINLSACSDYELEDYGAVGPERKCSDDIDNDGDGKIDCDDSDCATAAICNGGDPETNCTDKVDNDNDGAVDCADADCNDDPACNEPKCGNNVLEEGEGCDGELFGERTCVSYGFTGGELTCTSACRVSTANCEYEGPECGDGVCEGDEESTCPADCESDPVCGNGIMETGEGCDGNDFNGRTCSFYGYDSGSLDCRTNCTIDAAGCYNSSNPENCSNGADDDADGFVDCDDADCWDDYSCHCGNGYCESDYNETSATCPADCTNTVVCGNGVKEGSEVCDGNAFGGLTCSSYGFTYGSLSCTNSCGTISTSNCYNTNTVYCGNGVKDSGEVCDGNAFGGLSCASYGFDYGSLLCTNSCGTISTTNCYDNNSSSCGNGILESGEQCDSNTFPSGLGCDDYGFSSGYLSCGTGCTVSTANCYNPSTYYCGNGVLNSSEGCDGSYFGGKTCSTFGYDYGTLSCNSNCTVNTSSCYDSTSATCGNGVLNSGEACDGSLFSGKTCSTFGYSSGYLSCTNYCTISTANCSNGGSGSEICGNGLDDDSDGLVDFLDSNCSNTAYERYCADGIDNDSDGDVDCWDQDCIGSSSCRDSTTSGTTFLAVMPREGAAVQYFGCDGTDNTSWNSDYCTGTALMINGQISGRYMFAYTSSSCSAQSIINYGISWEAFNFLAVSPTAGAFANLACYVGCSVNPQTGLRTQANAVCVANKYNSNHIAQLDAYFGTDRIEIHSGSIASYLYWYQGIDPQ